MPEDPNIGKKKEILLLRAKEKPPAIIIMVTMATVVTNIDKTLDQSLLQTWIMRLKNTSLRLTHHSCSRRSSMFWILEHKAMVIQMIQRWLLHLISLQYRSITINCLIIAQAFQETWEEACKLKGSTMVVPSDYTFLVGPISFSGKNCQPNIVFQASSFLYLSWVPTPNTQKLTHIHAHSPCSWMGAS